MGIRAKAWRRAALVSARWWVGAGALLASGGSVLAANAAPAELEEVIVTAQRRAESLQKVPIAVTAISNEAIADSSFLNLSDLQYLAPSVQFQPSTAPVYQIRGVGTQTFDFGVEGSVGVFIDDVVQALPRSSMLGTFADVKQVQVLRGPQGTLFGKNTSAGAIVVTTNRPELGEWHNNARLTYGTDNETLVQDTLNVPLGNSVAARLTGAYQRRDGFVNNRFNGDELYEYENISAYAKLLWAVNDRFEAYFIGDYQSHEDNAGSIWTIRSYGAGTATDPSIISGTFIRDMLTSYGVKVGPDNHDGAWNASSYSEDDTTGGQLSLTYSFGSGHTLTSISAARRYKYDLNTESDSAPVAFFDVNDAFIDSDLLTQEIRLTSPASGRVEYVAGLYYFKLDTDAGGLLAGTLGRLPLDSTTLLTIHGSGAPRWRVESESYAAFANATVHLTERLGLHIGARYTRDEVFSRYNVVPQANVCQIPFAFGAPCTVGPLPTPYSAATVDHGGWSGKAGLQFDLSDDVMAYASIARGYKGPTVNNVSGEATPVKPETSIDYEAGLKSSFLDRRLVVNLAYFYDEIEDFQAQTYDTSTSPGRFIVSNAGGLVSRGLELELYGRAANGFDVSLGVTYADTYFTDYLTRCNPGVCTGMQDPRTGLFVPGLFQAAGERLTAAPLWTTVLGLGYERQLRAGLQIDATANYLWKDSMYYSVGDPNTKQDAYGLLNLNLGIGSDERHWRVGVFARNALDKRFVSRIGPTSFDVGGYRNGVDPNGAAFRTLGVSLDLSF